jgi:hypothetical protein
MPAPKGSRPNLSIGHGVRFEAPIVKQIKGLAEHEGVSYSEMARVLVDEAILARLSRKSDLSHDVLREATLHAIEFGGGQDTYRYSSMDTRFGAPFEGDDDGDGQK